MSHSAQIMFWGLAVIMPFSLNMTMKAQSDAVGLSGMLVLIWAIGRMLWALMGPPACMALNPVIDGLAGATAFTAWLTRRRAWKLALTGLYIGQVGLAFDFWLGWPGASNLWRYIAMNNAFLVAELLCCMYPGARDAVATLSSRGVFARARLVRHGGP